MEQSGDADPGFSPDGKTILSSRGFPAEAQGIPSTERRLFSISSSAWTAGKPELDLGPSGCIIGVPKVSPDGESALVFRACAGDPFGVYSIELATKAARFVADGFGPDFNPIASR